MPTAATDTRAQGGAIVFEGSRWLSLENNAAPMIGC